MKNDYQIKIGNNYMKCVPIYLRYPIITNFEYFMELK